MSERYTELLKLIEYVGVAPGLGSAGLGWSLEQSPTELAQFLDDCIGSGVKSMLELGVGEHGGVSRLVYQYLGWSVTSIDHRAPTVEVGRFILGETGDPDVLAQVKNERFDLVLIDADHHYDSVARDHRWYAPLATKVVALHDIAWGRPGCEGTTRFWWELSRSANIPDLAATGDLEPGFEDVIDPNHPIGIGYYEVTHE